MKSILLKMFIPMVVDMITEMLTKDKLDIYIDKLFDLIEDFVTNSESSIDDMIVLPVVQQLRSAFNVPDND